MRYHSIIAASAQVCERVFPGRVSFAAYSSGISRVRVIGKLYHWRSWRTTSASQNRVVGDRVGRLLWRQMLNGGIIESRGHSMRGSTRRTIAREHQTVPKKKPGLTCILPTCSHPNLVEVTPEQIEMTETDIQQVRLNEDGTLRRCKHCGCITEQYRDKDHELQYRKIGEYDSMASPNGFTIRPKLLQEYRCLVKNRRAPNTTHHRMTCLKASLAGSHNTHQIDKR